MSNDFDFLFGRWRVAHRRVDARRPTDPVNWQVRFTRDPADPRGDG